MNSKTICNLLAAIGLILVSAQSCARNLPSQAIAPSPAESDMTCSDCHEKQFKSMTDSSMHASVHAAAGVDNCTSCHDAAALRESHVNVKPGEMTFVKARRYPQEFCLRCHGTYADLAERTADSKALTDDKGRVINPHDIPKTPKHERLTECSNCHKEHKKNPDVMRNCSGCHHTGEFSCGECHPG
jgi:hypothetical protein